MPDAPLTLAIETSNPSSAAERWTAVAIGRARPEGDGSVEVLARASLEPVSRHDDALLPAIDRACRDAGIAPADLARVAISIGPGGFTALRIAATVAKMLALAHSTDCVGVPTAQALIRRAETRNHDSEIAVALGWKRDSVWIERFDPAGRRLSAKVQQLDTLDLSTCSLLIADDRFVATLRSASLLPEQVGVHPPRFDAVAVLEASAAIDPTPPIEFGPLYPREPEAVTKWRELHGG